MVVVSPKRLDEIVRMLAGHTRVLLLGCNTCAAVALAGGDREVETMIQSLRLATSRRGMTIGFIGGVLQRQCEPEYIDAMEAEEYDAILSLGCGAGVAMLAAESDVPVYPALNTLFIGAAQGFASWRAECSACGTCVLGDTAGICPVTRCAKGIMDGPCGGVNEGQCELGDRPCAWVEIHERLEAQGRVEMFAREHPPKDDSLGKLAGLDLSGPGGAP
ncbi:MAG: hypothetical protein FDZ70_00815 [Actinobacteria bacterium]|nr:MAG: hypothetical protein FDZ70_00815 [Actinomycetota bacterium]